MMNEFTHQNSIAGSKLRGAKGWLITDGKAGMVAQVQGVAEALGLDYCFKTVNPTGLLKWMSPWGPVGRHVRFGEQGAEFGPPWPEIAIATGRVSIPYVRALKAQAGSSCFTVVLQDPKTGPSTADLIWVPEHDRRRGANVITTLTAPHGFSSERLELRRQVIPDAISKLPKPRVAVILGGKNSVYKFEEQDDLNLQSALQSIALQGVGFMVTTSRRTHKRLENAVRMAIEAAPHIFWSGTGDNPYVDFLAHADWLIVTADSVNMTSEACATGRPVYVFEPEGGSAKFTRFHEALRRY
ncbi:MAG: mitochondrial fission ELM1 family protein, partial [Hyphomicrobiaceae bacterium]